VGTVYFFDGTSTTMAAPGANRFRFNSANVVTTPATQIAISTVGQAGQALSAWLKTSLNGMLQFTDNGGQNYVFGVTSIVDNTTWLQLAVTQYSVGVHPGNLFAEWANITPAPSVVTLPVGAMAAWGGLAASVPAGYLPCDGTTRPQATYPELFAVIGTTYNTGGEAGTDFRLPNLKDRFPMGLGTRFTTLGAGADTYTHVHALSVNDHAHGMSDHYHDIQHTHTTGVENKTIGSIPGGGSRNATDSGHAHGTNSMSVTNSNWTAQGLTGTYGAGALGGTADSRDHTPPYLVVNYIIRATPSTVGGGASGGASGLTMSSPILTGGSWITVSHNLGLVARDVSFTEVVSGEARLVDWRVKSGNSTADIEVRSGVDRAINYYTIYVEA